MDDKLTGQRPQRFPPTIEWTDAAHWPILSVAQSRRVDEDAIEHYGIAGRTLMENAGGACAERLLRAAPSGTAPWLILVGSGNNGGDGYVIARHAHQAAQPVAVVSLVPADKLRGDARLAWQAAVEAGVSIEILLSPEQVGPRVRRHEGWILDCLLGTGSQGPPREPMATAIRAANETGASKPPRGEADRLRRVAIDLPSGLDGDTGEPADPTFRADLTLTFVAPKAGLRTAASQPVAGRVEIVDIGLPEALQRSLGIPMATGNSPESARNASRGVH